MNRIAEKPITNERLPIGKMFEELVLDEMPINKWCAQQDRLLKGKKF